MVRSLLAVIRILVGTLQPVLMVAGAIIVLIELGLGFWLEERLVLRGQADRKVAP